MASSQALGLDGNGAAWNKALGFLADGFHIRAHNNHGLPGSQGGGSGQHMPQKRTSGRFVQNLGDGGLHAGAHSRRQNDKCSVYHALPVIPGIGPPAQYSCISLEWDYNTTLDPLLHRNYGPPQSAKG